MENGLAAVFHVSSFFFKPSRYQGFRGSLAKVILRHSGQGNRESVFYYLYTTFFMCFYTLFHCSDLFWIVASPMSEFADDL